MLYKNLSIIILAAGNGSRMLSDIPKVMHKIAGKFMLQHLIDSIVKIEVQAIYIVYGCRHERIKKMLYLSNKISSVPIHWILQYVPLGTGHAVQKVLPMISDDSEVLILYGDVPFVSNNTLKRLFAIKSKCDICLLIANVVNPSGYGRIIRDHRGNIVRILEHNDIIEDCYKDISEINSGVFITTASYLKIWVNKLIPRNINGELYLTDVIDIAYKSGCIIHSIHPIDTFEIIGINNKSDLIRAEREFKKKQAQYLLLSGVIISDPNRFDLRGTLEYGRDVYIDVNVIIEGCVSLGNRVQIGSGCILKNVMIEDDVIIYPFSIIENSKIKFQSKIGPFARLRPGTKLQEKTYVGNFVELKNTQLGTNSKVGHLSYLGDTEIGKQINIGAGTVVCNYDGVKKHRTIIEDNVFIGSDSQLIAPITVGKYATIGAGTTFTQNVAEGETVISRIRQFSILSRKLLQNKDKT